MEFKVVVPLYNSYPWLERSLESIATQKEAPFSVCIVDDASTDPRVGRLLEQYSSRVGWAICRQERNQGPLASFCKGIERLAPADEDVIVVVDGDDWLAHDRVLATLYTLYQTEPVDATYGSFITDPTAERGYCYPYAHEQVYQREIRMAKMGFGHLRTFRAFLWNEVKRSDLLDRTGAPLKLATEWAYCPAVLEMAGERARYIDELLYVRNLENPLSEFRIERLGQCATEFFHRSRPSYPRHPRCMRQTTGVCKVGRWQEHPTQLYIKVVGGEDRRTEESIVEQTYPYLRRDCASARDEEVIVEIRAGDWFLRSDALERIADQYATGEIDATFGDALYEGRRYLTPYSFADLRQGDLSHPHRGAAPPYTYRAGLWRGDFLELVGRLRHRVCFLDTPLYAIGHAT